MQQLRRDFVGHVHGLAKWWLRAVVAGRCEGDVVLLLVIRRDDSSEAGALQHGDEVGEGDEIAWIGGVVTGTLGAAHQAEPLGLALFEEFWWIFSDDRHRAVKGAMLVELPHAQMPRQPDGNVCAHGRRLGFNIQGVHGYSRG